MKKFTKNGRFLNLLSSDPAWGEAAIVLESNSLISVLFMLVSLLQFSILLFIFLFIPRHPWNCTFMEAKV